MRREELYLTDILEAADANSHFGPEMIMDRDLVITFANSVLERATEWLKQ
jgi:hypothetical protein